MIMTEISMRFIILLRQQKIKVKVVWFIRLKDLVGLAVFYQLIS